ncbi:MAG: Uma2 family endonuclease, partial [Microcystaceae cyanobacterium]
APLIVLEFVSGDGKEERDNTPYQGKFWIYEQVIRPAFYGIYEVKKASVEVYRWVAGRYEQINPNERGHYPIAPMGVELGIWQGYYLNAELPWLRWLDEVGNLLLTGEERALRERQRAEKAEQENARLREQLRALGVDPERLG